MLLFTITNATSWSSTLKYGKTLETRLSSNLRPTTRECVHLVTRGHFRSRDKDGGHTYHSTGHSRKAYIARKRHACMFYRTGVIADGSFTLRE